MFRFRRPLTVFASSLLFNHSTQSKSNDESKTKISSSHGTEPPFRHVNCTGFECLRESSMLTLSTSSSFLKQTLYYYTELCQRYGVLISSMIRTLEEYQRHQGNNESQQNIWNLFVKDRSEMNEIKGEILRLRLLLTTIERLVNESIDASYQTQDETVTQLVSSEIVQVKRIIEQNEQMICKFEMSLTEVQVKLIEPSSS